MRHPTGVQDRVWQPDKLCQLHMILDVPCEGHMGTKSGPRIASADLSLSKVAERAVLRPRDWRMQKPRRKPSQLRRSHRCLEHRLHFFPRRAAIESGNPLQNPSALAPLRPCHSTCPRIRNANLAWRLNYPDCMRYATSRTAVSASTPIPKIIQKLQSNPSDT